MTEPFCLKNTPHYRNLNDDSGGLDILDLINGLVLLGGDDLHPRYYGNTIHDGLKLEDNRQVETRSAASRNSSRQNVEAAP